MSIEGDVFGHQFSLDMQDGLPLGLDVDPTAIQESDDEEVHYVLNLTMAQLRPTAIIKHRWLIHLETNP